MAATFPPASDHGFARWLAERAGERLVALRDEVGFADPAALRDAGDARSHEYIVSQLAQWRPADAVLSEEGADDPRRLTADRVWIVDPLDGTREFGEAGRDDWAVHIALWSHGRLVAGAVGLPASHRSLATEPPPPYPPLSEAGQVRIAVSRSRPPAFLDSLAEQLSDLGGVEPVAIGSAGAKIVAVVDGFVDAYVHAGGQYEWDSAAPVAVATATGLHASRINGDKLEYNQQNLRLPDLVVCRKDLAPRLLAALARCG